MKYSFFVIVIFLTCITGVEANNNHVPEALVALSKKLASLTTVSFHYYRESNYPESNYFGTVEGDCYLEFDEPGKQTVSRFRLECNEYIQVYNGTESIFLDKKAKTYSIKARPKQRLFSTYSFFFNSIQALRSMIPQWIQNDSMPMFEGDTLIQNRTYKLVRLNIRQYPLEYLGSNENSKRLPDSVTLYYAIIIDPETGLPYQVLHTNNINSSINKTVFTGINTKSAAPEAKSWYLAAYQNEYTPQKKVKGTPLIAVGAVMPEWLLPECNGKNDPVYKSSHLKGRLVLLDFWIKNCAHCMESFPELQRLQKTYGNNSFQLVSINAADKKEDVDFFYKREKPLYKMLYNGADLAKMLGVDGFPTVVLIDKTGKVIYSGAFNYGKVDDLIKANL